MENTSGFKVGDRVKLSGYSIQRYRDDWNSAGRSDDKARKRKWLDDALAVRGTVIALFENQFTTSGIEVRHDTGATERALSYKWELAN